MSIITVQIGQCGNQIGTQLFSTIYDDIFSKDTGIQASKNEDYMDAALNRFFSCEGSVPEARAVMVDMEQKVISQAVSAAKRTGRWRFASGQQYVRGSGSGNNWARGFAAHGPRASDAVLDMLRHESEKCDRADGFLFATSLAGGTGSGVGARLCARVREEHPRAVVVCHAVAPYAAGEVAVQSYNALLTLASLRRGGADAVVLSANDDLHAVCATTPRGGGGREPVSFDDLNAVACRQLAAALLPAEGAPPSLSDVVDALAPHADYRLLSMRHAPQPTAAALPFTEVAWTPLLRRLRRMHAATSARDEGFERESGRVRSVADLLTVRGDGADDADCDAIADHRGAVWAPPGERVRVRRCRRRYGGLRRSAVLVSNSQAVLGTVEGITEKAWRLFASRAYLHQYVACGLTEDDFVQSFADVEQVIHSYRHL
ncbi:PREDICTED: tubulin delta chain-like [Priapulus caudatus]|uniref:Tubulin delta chain n=1 Tax=Priapulus caudatus TaxID=37621 RepID=A0ABM1EDV5_PRICU|nr:PREDICTED: tubulin delta chain-like [Priapulus caudatus]